jgi:DUF1680 family protein
MGKPVFVIVTALLCQALPAALLGAASGAETMPRNQPMMQRVTAGDPAVLLFGSWSGAAEARIKTPGGAGIQPAPGVQQTDGPGSACVVIFRGPRLRWLGGRGPDHGRADVYVDGRLAETVDAYDPEEKAEQVLFEQGGLDPDARHTLRIVVRRDRHERSAGRRQRLVAFEAAEVVDYPQQVAGRARQELLLLTTGKKPYLAPEQWKPAAYAAEAPARGVTLDGGPLRDAFEANIACLNRWFESREQWQRQFPTRGWEKHLPASSEGRMLGGAAHTLRWGERQDMRAVLDAIVAIVKARQRPDGYCMPFPEEHMKPSGNAWLDERRNYDRVNLTRGMVAAGMVGNRDALPVMRRFYDWLYASPYSAGLLAGPFDNGSSHNCNNGHEGGLLMHFSPVGRPEDLVAVERYFVQDFFLEESARAEPLSLSHYPFHVPHSYVLLAYKAWLDHYRATGAAKYLQAAQGAWRIVRDHYLHVGGTLAICEHRAGTYPPGSYFLRVDKAHHTGETCGSVFWADVNHRLLQFFPDEAKYADEIEQAIFNVVLAAQDAAGNIRYHNRLEGQKDEANFKNTCCEVMASPFLAALPQYVYSLDRAGLYVNLYAPSTVSWEHGGRPVTLAASTDFPFDGRVALKVAAGAPQRMKVRIRVPGWVRGEVAVQVNGQPVARGKPGTYVILDRSWQQGDAVTFDLPMGFRTVRYTGLDQHPEHERHALLYGPILMALVGAADLPIPAAELPGRLKPIAGQPLHFGVEGVGPARYVPYWQINNETFSCFPTAR